MSAVTENVIFEQKNMQENVIYFGKSIRKCDFLIIFAAENVIL